MSWKIHANPKALPPGTGVRATAGENVIYGTLGNWVSDGWVMLKLPVQPSEPFMLNLVTWTISTEVLTFWDVMEDADIGTTAQRKDSTTEALYVKVVDKVINAESLGVVAPDSALAALEASNFGWSYPATWFPSSD